MVRGHRGGGRLPRLLALALTGLLGLVATTAPVRADSAPSAGGSCGPWQGEYGYHGLGPEQFGGPANTVPAVYYKVDYNLLAPSTMGVLLRRDDDLGQVGFPLAVFYSQGTGGSFEGVWRADINPEHAGYSVTPNIGSGKFDGTASSQKFRGGSLSSYYMSGGIPPGGWYFVVYTGELRYDESSGWHFVADEKGYLGKFGCNIADDEGKK